MLVQIVEWVYKIIKKMPFFSGWDSRSKMTGERSTKLLYGRGKKLDQDKFFLESFETGIPIFLFRYNHLLYLIKMND